MKSFHPWLQKQHSLVTILFIAVSALLFAWIGQPVKMLILAGTLNGLILPIALGIVLVAAYRKDLMKQYQHPAWMSVAGWIVVAVMGSMASYSIWKFFN